MKTKLVVYWDPEELGIPKDALKNVNDVIENCFQVYKYTNESEALWAYANKHCTWSTLLDSDQDETSFMLEAYNHIERHDFDWLESNFT